MPAARKKKTCIPVARICMLYYFNVRSIRKHDCKAAFPRVSPLLHTCDDAR